MCLSSLLLKQREGCFGKAANDILFLYIHVILQTKSKDEKKDINYNSALIQIQNSTLSYVLAMFIPDIVVGADKSLLTVWTLVIWYTNFLFDPLIYVFFRFYKKTIKHLVYFQTWLKSQLISDKLSLILFE